MSPEGREVTVKVIVKKDAAAQKAEDYARTKSWGVATNQRLSQTGFWRK
ncbi:hypothetical protein HYZ06_00265 [Candidatus Daviesbacteria bacterium]|nr:hypothetical protein [Candidatus Daviesbacteria bacterium]